MERKPYRVMSADPVTPRASTIERTVAVLAEGGLAALPTETLYGLCVDSASEECLARVNRVKGKDERSPVLLLLAATEQIATVCDRVPELFARLAASFWPGPLTLVVPARAGLPPQLSAGGGVAVRVPGLALPRRVAARLGRPISGVSANLHGEPPCRSALEVARVFGDALDLVLDGGPTPAGAPSTILDLTARTPRVAREGILPLSALRPFTGL
jgi:L-threonylcarbamoyladenylate synthase